MSIKEKEKERRKKAFRKINSILDEVEYIEEISKRRPNEEEKEKIKKLYQRAHALTPKLKRKYVPEGQFTKFKYYFYLRQGWTKYRIAKHFEMSERGLRDWAYKNHCAKRYKAPFNLTVKQYDDLKRSLARDDQIIKEFHITKYQLSKWKNENGIYGTDRYKHISWDIKKFG